MYVVFYVTVILKKHDKKGQKDWRRLYITYWTQPNWSPLNNQILTCLKQNKVYRMCPVVVMEKSIPNGL